MKLFLSIIILTTALSQNKQVNTLSVGFYNHLTQTSFQYQRHFNNNSILIGSGVDLKTEKSQWLFAGFHHFGNWDIGLGVVGYDKFTPIFFSYGYKILIDKYYSIRLGGDLAGPILIPISAKLSVSF